MVFCFGNTVFLAGASLGKMSSNAWLHLQCEGDLSLMVSSCVWHSVTVKNRLCLQCRSGAPHLLVSEYKDATTLVIHCRIPPANAGTCVRSLVHEDSTCYQGHLARVSQLLAPCLRRRLCNKRSHCSKKPVYHSWWVASTGSQLEKAWHGDEDPAQPEISK